MFVGCKKDKPGLQYGDGVNDINLNAYESVIIGGQEWMAENLRTTKYSDGTTISNVTDDKEWQDLTTGAWSNYGNNQSNGEKYGKLYNGYTVETGKLCPTGWRVPTDAEWTLLIDYLSVNGHKEFEGTALKATSGWISGNGTDDFGWKGLSGGTRNGYGDFASVGYGGDWWSSSDGNGVQINPNGTEFSVVYLKRSLSYDSGDLHRSYLSKSVGLSVRCLRD